MRCPDGTCLSAEERCDGQMHCSDGSDEPITCGKVQTDRSAAASGLTRHLCCLSPDDDVILWCVCDAESSFTSCRTTVLGEQRWLQPRVC